MRAAPVNPEDIVALRTDPDFRREPKTHDFCALCQRDLHGPRRWGFLIHDGFVIVHPAWASAFDGEKSTPGWVQIGPECAKRFPPDWTKESQP